MGENEHATVPKEMAAPDEDTFAGVRVGSDTVTPSNGKAEAILRRP